MSSGFTFIELVVIILIISILIAIAVTIYNDIRVRAEETVIKANQRILTGSYQVYIVRGREGHWPVDYIIGATISNGIITLGDTEYILDDNRWTFLYDTCMTEVKTTWQRLR